MDGTWKSDIHAGLRLRLHGLQYDREAPKYRKKLHVLHPQCKSRDSCYRLKTKGIVNNQTIKNQTKYSRQIPDIFFKNYSFTVQISWYEYHKIFFQLKLLFCPASVSRILFCRETMFFLTFPIGFLIPIILIVLL